MLMSLCNSSVLSPRCTSTVLFFVNDPASTEIYTLSLHDALPICVLPRRRGQAALAPGGLDGRGRAGRVRDGGRRPVDRKSTRLNSSHLGISYAVFCLKKKTKTAETRSQLPQAAQRPEHANWSTSP